MSPKLPVVSGRHLVRILEHLGYERVRQRGSHIRLRHPTDLRRKPVTVPDHKELKRGLLHGILRDAMVSAEQLTELL